MTVKHKADVARHELTLACRLCESIDTPKSLCIFLLIRNNEFDQLCDLEINPADYLDWKSFMDDYQVVSLLSKNPRLKVSVDPEKRALEKFWDAEKYCSETNSRIDRFLDGQDFPDPDVTSAVIFSQQYIQKILGPLDREKLNYSVDNMRFGPGATTSLSGVVTQGKKYMHRVLDATPRLLPFRTFGFPTRWRATATEISLRRSTKLRVVPKKANCGRTINIEPDLNIFVQLGQGALIRRQLRNFGLDLQSQEKNQRMAQQASIDDSLVTMDLSSASDLISRSVVWLLLPYSWADYLHMSRVDFVETDSGDVELHKWSSMGNGYTFELETLIFYSILLGASEVMGWPGDVTAYGDDLIFPVELEDLIRRTLKFLGFKVNSQKTFGKGSFRESCGTDWFDGHNVRPIYLKADHHDYPTINYIYANSIRRWAYRRNNDGTHDVRCLPFWLRCFTAVDERFRFRIPEGFGDVGFVSSFEEATPSVDRTNGWGGLFFRYRGISAVEKVIDQEGCYLAFLNGTITDFKKSSEALRGRFQNPRTKKGYVLTWPLTGPWA